MSFTTAQIAKLIGGQVAGDGNAPQKAYAAAFVLILIVLALNGAVGRISRLGAGTRIDTGRLAR